ncbi:hypothetical protein C7S18_22395 [Ahniella affigens]|uniref:Uncharacterized protein n=1 Tax=Ahniella affigens TaxID=2021234 RepID=A0A2P1PY64_9GAMM|nr:hypothetical protein [Ahniella affigens]AVP99754.1 hypothetical protein C7S18_22395 [Ahniella affigens]
MRDNNPSQTPAAELSHEAMSAQQALQIRLEHQRAEAHLTSAGSLFGLVALVAALTCLSAYSSIEQLSGSHSEGDFIRLRVLAWCLPASLACGVLSFGLQTFKPWIPWPATIGAILVLPLLGPGTLLGLYTLYAVWSSTGRRVLAWDYRAIRCLAPSLPHPPLPWWQLLVGTAILIAIAWYFN